MNLAKLLGMGQSFFGRGSLSYRESRRPYVPKFNDGKNPFTPKAAPEKKNPAPTVAAAPVKTEPRSLLGSRAPRATSWVEKMNPFRAPEPVKTFIRAEQPELSLENLRVLRNDLSEADIERVPAKSQTVAPAPVRAASRTWELVNAG